MSRYRAQGEGEIVPGRGIEIAELLLERRGVPTLVEFDDGSTLITSESAYGRDISEEWEHLYLEAGGQTFVASSSQVVRLHDPVSGARLFERSSNK
jgi:hypothetical protein